jgi:hypothetical protein
MNWHLYPLHGIEFISLRIDFFSGSIYKSHRHANYKQVGLSQKTETAEPVPILHRELKEI